MTREEALDYLKRIKENYHWCCEEDALEIAIKALEHCEVWNGIHGQVVAPKGTFNRIWNDAKEEQEPKTDRIEYGTDGNPYRLTISNGKEYEQEPKTCEKCLYAEETDGSHCYECVKGESRFETQESEGRMTFDELLSKAHITTIKMIEQEPMREFTEEESKAYSKALDKMYKPTGVNIFDEPCEEYRRGWHDAIGTALKETINYYTEDGVFSAIQEESLIGVGMSMPEPKTDSDAISREKTCDYIAEFVNNEFSTNEECEMVDAMIEGIQHLPSVKPKEPKTEYYPPCVDCHSKMDEIRKAYDKLKEPKTGHWIDGHCSECGCDVPAYIIDWTWKKDMEAKYCPNCGCRMEMGVSE